LNVLLTSPDEKVWSQFQREFDSAGVLTLSAVVFSPDLRDAIVRYGAHCGGACGEGGYVWLRRQGSTERWVVARAFASWFS
jgi:hypothetical protein